jgi:hypothetical protein
MLLLQKQVRILDGVVPATTKNLCVVVQIQIIKIESPRRE